MLVAGHSAWPADLVEHASHQDPTSVHVWQRQFKLLPGSVREGNPDVPLQKRGHRIPVKSLFPRAFFQRFSFKEPKKGKEYRFRCNLPVDHNEMLRTGKEEGRDRGVVTNLLGEVESLRAVFKLIATPKELSQHWIIRLLHSLTGSRKERKLNNWEEKKREKKRREESEKEERKVMKWR